VKFAEFVCVDAIKAELAINDKEGVVRELAQALLDDGRFSQADFQPIVAAVLEREELGSTWIGRGSVGALLFRTRSIRASKGRSLRLGSVKRVSTSPASTDNPCMCSSS